jgi:hypothetical protein
MDDNAVFRSQSRRQPPNFRFGDNTLGIRQPDPRLGLHSQVQREVTFGDAPATFPADGKLNLAKADENHMS